MTFADVLGEVSVKRDLSHDRTDVVWWDFFSQACASSSQSGWLHAISRSLEEHAVLLCLPEMDLKVCETILVEELDHDLHPPDGWDLSEELDEARACVGRSADDRTAKSERLLQ
jgi:hypothetical protein